MKKKNDNNKKHAQQGAAMTIKHLFFINHKINIQLDFMWQVGVACGMWQRRSATILAYFTLLLSMQTIFLLQYYYCRHYMCLSPHPSQLPFPCYHNNPRPPFAVLQCFFVKGIYKLECL